jgi:hypothetical protein
LQGNMVGDKMIIKNHGHLAVHHRFGVIDHGKGKRRLKTKL